MKKITVIAGLFLISLFSFADVTTTAKKDASNNTQKVKKGTGTTTGDEIVGDIDNKGVALMVATEETSSGLGGLFLTEVVGKSYQGPGRGGKDYSNKVEWTIAKGIVNFGKNGKFGFFFDNDRDYNMNKNGKATYLGWDTKNGFNYKAGEFNMFGKKWSFVPTVSFLYDTKENFTYNSSTPNAANKDTRREFDFLPIISGDVMGFNTDFVPIFAYDDIKENFGLEFRVDTNRQLNKNWSMYGSFYFDFALTHKNGNYNNSTFQKDLNKGQRVDFSFEQYLAYKKQLGDTNFYFLNEFGLEAYGLLQSDKSDVALYTYPQFYYEFTVGKDKTTKIIPYVKYVAYTKSGEYASDKSSAYARDYLSVGIKLSTKL